MEHFDSCSFTLSHSFRRADDNFRFSSIKPKSGVSIMVSVTVIKTMTNSNLGRKTLILVYNFQVLVYHIRRSGQKTNHRKICNTY